MECGANRPSRALARGGHFPLAGFQMTRTIRTICYLATIAAWPPVALAQITLAQTAPPVVPAAPPATPGATTAPPEVIAPPAQSAQGVIHPPATDPAIVKPTPPIAPQSMPVIPPPGTAGSNSNVVPK